MSNEITNSLQPITLEQSPEDEIETKIQKIMDGGFKLQTELGEKPIWHFEWVDGMFSKSIQEIWSISNYRVLKMDVRIGRLIQVPLKYVDVAVTNVQSIGQSRGVAYGAGMPGTIAMGVAVMNRVYKSARFGILNFIADGGIALQFHNILDPNGVKQLVKTVQKQMYGKEKFEKN